MVFTIAMIVHLVLSVVLALVIAWTVSRRHLGMGLALVLGAAFGLLVYFVNFYPTAAILFPWFAMARNWVTTSSHVAFGVVLAWAYLALTRRKPLGSSELSLSSDDEAASEGGSRRTRRGLGRDIGEIS